MSATDRVERLSVVTLLAACSSLLLSTACTQRNEAPEQAANEVAPAPAVAARNDAAFEWARDALTRNAQVELVASDPETQVFTLRNKQTGEVSAVKLSELAAAPSAQLASTSVATQPVLSATPIEQPSPSQTAESTQTQASSTRSSDANPTSSTTADSEGGYTIERSEGQVRVTGPGVSIVSSGAQGAADSNSLQASSDPIICEGPRMLHFDNREFIVEGDAITVRGGCELYLTNSRVIATGTGIVVQDGTVHVSNSHVEGQEGSFDADNRAKIFVRGSTFRGLPRRTELAQVQDQGGNRWR